MSSTLRGSERLPDDFYITPYWCVHRLLENSLAGLSELSKGVWLDPCAGDGAIQKAAIKFYDSKGPNWYCVEKQAQLINDLSLGFYNIDEWETDDFFSRAIREDIKSYLKSVGRERFDVVLTNPPFAHAQAFIKSSLRISRKVAMLMRLNYLAPKKRSKWLRNNMPDIFVLPNRPSFDGGGTDSIEYCWMVWDSDFPSKTGSIEILELTSLDERKQLGEIE